jgi:cleavage and polyadenylation specificity factor subunit 3
MMRLKSKLLSLNANKTAKVKVYSPRNCEELRIPFKADKTAKVVGKLASIQPPLSIHPDQAAAPPLVTGVLVQNDFKLSLMAPEDLREYAGLNTTTITCKQRLTLSAAGVDLVKWALEGTFGNIEELPEMRRGKNGQSNGHADKMITDDVEMKEEDADEEVASLVAAYLVMGCVSVRYRTNGEVELEWEGNMLNDGIADSVMAVLFSVESSPAAVKRSSAKHSHSHELPDVNPHHSASPEERLERLLWFLEAQFGQENVAPVTTPKLPPLEEADDKIKKNSEDEDAMKTEEDGEDTQLQERQAKEIERLHKIGIPVPGVSIKVDRMTATVWLEDLEVESNNKVFADRVRAVVERAVEVTAPLWG